VSHPDKQCLAVLITSQTSCPETNKSSFVPAVAEGAIQICDPVVLTCACTPAPFLCSQHLTAVRGMQAHMPTMHLPTDPHPGSPQCMLGKYEYVRHCDACLASMNTYNTVMHGQTPQLFNENKTWFSCNSSTTIHCKLATGTPRHQGPDKTPCTHSMSMNDSICLTTARPVVPLAA
jgi:hypothetical protein